jgi:hypothetical protein
MAAFKLLSQLPGTGVPTKGDTHLFSSANPSVTQRLAVFVTSR